MSWMDWLLNTMAMPHTSHIVCNDSCEGHISQESVHHNDFCRLSRHSLVSTLGNTTSMCNVTAKHLYDIGLVQGLHGNCTCKLMCSSGTNAHRSLSFIKARKSPRHCSEDHGNVVCSECTEVTIAWHGMSSTLWAMYLRCTLLHTQLESCNQVQHDCTCALLCVRQTYDQETGVMHTDCVSCSQTQTGLGSQSCSCFDWIASGYVDGKPASMIQCVPCPVRYCRHS